MNNKRILIFNTGSSSIKYKIYLIDGKNLIEEKSGEINEITSPQGPKNHVIALTLLFHGFGIRKGILENIDNLAAIGHRVVHGGNKFSTITKIDKNVINEINNFSSLAPLHNPPIIEVIKKVFNESQSVSHRNIKSYAIFDTGFYKDLPKVSKIYPIPLEYYEKYGIQRYGFHGISHKNAYNETIKKFGKLQNVISIHLGSGCSITAIKNGVPIDTSMGFTPQEGLMMGTRAGDIDSGIIFYMLNKLKIKPDKLSKILNCNSGLVGLSESSPEMLDILFLAGYRVEDSNYAPNEKIQSLSKKHHENALIALEIYVNKIKKYIGAYFAILGGVDALVFTGKIGYGSSIIRDLITRDLETLLKNAKINVVRTDEELQIAKEIINYIE
jgi:acetate kinase